MTSYVPWPARKLRSEYDSVGPDAWAKYDFVETTLTPNDSVPIPCDVLNDSSGSVPWTFSATGTFPTIHQSGVYIAQADLTVFGFVSTDDFWGKLYLADAAVAPWSHLSRKQSAWRNGTVQTSPVYIEADDENETYVFPTVQWDRPSGTHTAVAVFGSLWLTKIA